MTEFGRYVVVDRVTELVRTRVVFVTRDRDRRVQCPQFPSVLGPGQHVLLVVVVVQSLLPGGYVEITHWAPNTISVRNTGLDNTLDEIDCCRDVVWAAPHGRVVTATVGWKVRDTFPSRWVVFCEGEEQVIINWASACLLYTSDAADE